MAPGAERIHLEVVTPERKVFAAEVEEVVLPSVEGYLGVLPGHAPLLAALDVGELSYRVGQARHYLTISGGYAEVLRHSVNVLARTCELAEEIDLRRAENARDRAREQLREGSSAEEFRRAEVQLKRAMSRIQVHARLKG